MGIITDIIQVAESVEEWMEGEKKIVDIDYPEYSRLKIKLEQKGYRIVWARKMKMAKLEHEGWKVVLQIEKLRRVSYWTEDNGTLGLVLMAKQND